MPATTTRRRTCPAIVLCQGLSGVKDKVLPEVGRTFSQAGYITLAFDYRGYGDSANVRPRPSLFPMERVDDVLSALSFMESLQGVDPHRIGLYGISYGGPVALAVASQDSRVRCLVVVSGPADGEDFMRALRTKKQWDVFQKEMAQDRVSRTRTGKSRLVALEEVVPFPPAFWEKYRSLGSENESESIPRAVVPQGRPMLSLESAEAMTRFRPSASLPFPAAKPVLFLHGEKDNVAPIGQAKALYRRIKAPKKFITFPGKDHIDLDGGEGLQTQMRLSLDWFGKYLPTT